MSGLGVNTVRTLESLAPRYLPRLDPESVTRAAVTTPGARGNREAAGARAAAHRLERPRSAKPHVLLLSELRGGGVFRDVFVDFFGSCRRNDTNPSRAHRRSPHRL